jgi:hypothetical protein
MLGGKQQGVWVGEEEEIGTVVLWRSKIKSVEGVSEDLGPRRASRR